MRILLYVAMAAVVLALGLSTVTAADTWYKGNVHCHSFWSDGDALPEMAAHWYKSHGYHFLAMSDHNVVQTGNRWRGLQDKRQPMSAAALAECRERFGLDWVEIRGEGATAQVRLRRLDEFRPRLESPGKFLLFDNEEITGHVGDREVHVNAMNLAEDLEPQSGRDVAEMIRADVAAVAQQSQRLGRPMLAILNHPNWRWYDITPEDLAAAPELRLLEVANVSPGSNHLGDAVRPSTDKVWDVANTLRIAAGKPPLWGVAGDDAHEYRAVGPDKASPGRGWIMVRATELSTDAIVAAIERGDFYGSTGVVLRDCRLDKQKGEISVEVEPHLRAQYVIEFIGTRVGTDATGVPVQAPAPPKAPPRTVLRYPAAVGEIFLSVQGPRATYKFKGDELYVRAVVRSSLRLPNPLVGEARVQEAWCQPCVRSAK